MANWKFESAAVIGTGMMGPGIALTLALGGVRAAILSRHEDSARQGLAKAHSQIDLLASNDLVAPDAAAHAKSLITATSKFDETVAGVDLVVESAPEDMAFKQEMFAHMDRIAKPSAALATNTSGLSVTAIASACSNHPERVITTHFWNPPHLMRLVEIVKGQRTDDSLALAIQELLTRCGKMAVIVKKDTPGQLGNRLQMALVREAVHIVQEGIADVEDVDNVVKNGFGCRLPVYGVFEHQDMVGLDMASSILDYVATDLNCERKSPDLMRRHVAAGELGVKTGKGFYDWSVKSAGEVRARRDQFVLAMLKRKGS